MIAVRKPRRAVAAYLRHAVVAYPLRRGVGRATSVVASRQGSRRAWAAALAALVLVVGCRGGAGGMQLENIDATVEHFPIDSDNLVLVRDSNPDERYLPDDLPPPFRLAGLKVRFSARIVPPPPNARLYGTPIRLLHIERRDGVNPS